MHGRRFDDDPELGFEGGTRTRAIAQQAATSALPSVDISSSDSGEDDLGVLLNDTIPFAELGTGPQDGTEPPDQSPQLVFGLEAAKLALAVSESGATVAQVDDDASVASSSSSSDSADSGQHPVPEHDTAWAKEQELRSAIEAEDFDGVEHYLGAGAVRTMHAVHRGQLKSAMQGGVDKAMLAKLQRMPNAGAGWETYASKAKTAPIPRLYFDDPKLYNSEAYVVRSLRRFVRCGSRAIAMCCRRSAPPSRYRTWHGQATSVGTAVAVSSQASEHHGGATTLRRGHSFGNTGSAESVAIGAGASPAHGLTRRRSGRGQRANDFFVQGEALEDAAASGKGRGPARPKSAVAGSRSTGVLFTRIGTSDTASRRRVSFAGVATVATSETADGDADSGSDVELDELCNPAGFTNGFVASHSPRGAFLEECQRLGVSVVEPLLIRKIAVRGTAAVCCGALGSNAHVGVGLGVDADG